jgi:N-acetylglucosamine-6-phosphate deacetylase
MSLDGGRRLKPSEALGEVLQSPVTDNLAGDLLIRRHADYNGTAVAVQEGAKRLRGAGQLAGAFLELQAVGFATADESSDFRDCHAASAPPAAVYPIPGRREEW